MKKLYILKITKVSTKTEYIETDTASEAYNKASILAEKNNDYEIDEINYQSLNFDFSEIDNRFGRFNKIKTSSPKTINEVIEEKEKDDFEF